MFRYTIYWLVLLLMLGKVVQQRSVSIHMFTFTFKIRYYSTVDRKKTLNLFVLCLLWMLVCSETFATCV